MRLLSLASAAVLLFCTAGSFPQAPTAAPEPSFDVATIKPSDAASLGHVGVHMRDAVLTTTGTSPRRLLSLAFDVQENQILGLPRWAESVRYDVTAKDSTTDPAVLKNLPDAQFARMMQGLLVERFGLKWHTEVREMSGYELVAVKPTGALKPVAKELDTVSTHNRHMEARGVSMAGLAREFEEELGRPVVDHTGLKGFYDLDLRWRRDDEAANAAAANDPEAPPILLTAVQEQLGLKLRSSKQSVPVVVVDQLTPPTGN